MEVRDVRVSDVNRQKLQELQEDPRVKQRLQLMLVLGVAFLVSAVVIGGFLALNIHHGPTLVFKALEPFQGCFEFLVGGLGEHEFDASFHGVIGFRLVPVHLVSKAALKR